MHVSKAFLFPLSLFTAVMIAGCSSPRKEPVYAEPPGPSGSTAPSQTPEKRAVEAPPAQPVQPVVVEQAKKPEMIVTPDTTIEGSVVSVNEVGRFVVLRFPLGRMPVDGSTVYVYRQGLKVAELKVTGPQKDDHTVADIRSGECRVNDQARDR